MTKEQLKNPDGTFDPDKIEELFKRYEALQNNAKQVYSHITKGLLSGSHYSADMVISVYDNIQKGLIDRDTVCEDMIHIVDDPGTKQLILEYFGKLY